VREHSAPEPVNIGREIIRVAELLRLAADYQNRAPKRPAKGDKVRVRGAVADKTSSTATDERRLKVREAVRLSYVAIHHARVLLEAAIGEYEAAE